MLASVMPFSPTYFILYTFILLREILKKITIAICTSTFCMSHTVAGEGIVDDLLKAGSWLIYFEIQGGCLLTSKQISVK
jgi:hypothetical protein